MSSDFVITTDVLIFNRNQNNRSVNVPLRSLKGSRDTNEREPIYRFATANCTPFHDTLSLGKCHFNPENNQFECYQSEQRNVRQIALI